MKRFGAPLFALLVAGTLVFSQGHLFGADPTIRSKLEGKNYKERADIKATEVAKVAPQTFTKKGTQVEIISVEKIEGGVVVLARAYRNGEQLGFGKDGTVEIERFIFYNPPIMVSDPTGDHKKELKDADGNILAVKSFREDPEEALRQALEDTIRIVGKDGSNIQAGKIGNTTSTFYADTRDGWTREDNVAGGVTWATIHDASTGDGASSSGYLRISLRGGTTSNQWREQSRTIVPFDTSALGDTEVVSSATVSLYDVFASNNPSTYSLSVVVDTTIEASGGISTADYNYLDWRNVKQSNTEIPFTSFTASASYKDFPLNAHGIRTITATSTTRYGFRNSADFNNIEPTWANNVESDVIPSDADVAGTTEDPKLVLEHTTGTQTTEVFSTPGAGTYTSKSDVLWADVACWGGGGAGFDGGTTGGGRGGGGGAFASSSVAVSTSTGYSLSIGAGGTTSGANGATSTFATTIVVASPGDGGTSATTGGGFGGSASLSTGTTTKAGGRGGAGIDDGTHDGAGGGGGAGGSHGNGNVGGNAVGGTTDTGGAGGTGSNGQGGTAGSAGNGGNGGIGGVSIWGGGGGGGGDNGATGGVGGTYGAGGGGGETGQGNGANGACRVTYISAVSASAPPKRPPIMWIDSE